MSLALARRQMLAVQRGFARSSKFGAPRLRRKRVLGRVSRGLSADLHKYVLRFQNDISSSPGGQIDTVFSSSDPVAARDGTGTYQDFGSLQALYDLYRPISLHIRYIPHKPHDTSINTNYRPLFVVHDPDQTTQPVTNRDEAIQYLNMKIFQLDKSFSYRVKSTFNTSNTVNGGFLDIAVGANHGVGIVSWFANALDGSDNYGTVILTMTILCKARR